MKKKGERAVIMKLINNHNEFDSSKTESDLMKEVIFKLCIGEIPFTSAAKPVTLDYKDREILLLSKGAKVGSIPFEIIYFDIKRKQLEVKDYHKAILSLIEEEINKISSENEVIV